MIRHIVFFRAKRPEDIAAIRDGLSVLKRIPHASHLEIVLSDKLDQIANEVDVVVYGEFTDRAALAAYKAHPLYQDSIAAVRPLRDTRHAVDYEVSKEAKQDRGGELS